VLMQSHILWRFCFHFHFSSLSSYATQGLFFKKFIEVSIF
jgi:hypothetical protein